MRRIKKLAGVLVAALLTVQVLAVMPVYAEETGEKCCHADCPHYTAASFARAFAILVQHW